MTGKVFDFYPPTLPHGGTFSNVVTRPASNEELMANIRNAAALVKRLQMHVVTDERIILPHDWETRFSPEQVKAIKEYLGIQA